MNTKLHRLKMPAVYLLVIPNVYDTSTFKNDYLAMKRLLKIYHTVGYDIYLIKRRYHDMYVDEYVEFVCNYYNFPVRLYKSSYIKSKNISNYLPRFIHDDYDNRMNVLSVENFC